ncbi:hypothetical protein [Paracoccus cavernae]|uniref:hypothetical protein n=1 Tax=Paracoccus cavernae TaxID=1571207 RepID=UPI0036446870
MTVPIKPTGPMRPRKSDSQAGKKRAEQQWQRQSKKQEACRACCSGRESPHLRRCHDPPVASQVPCRENVALRQK